MPGQGHHQEIQLAWLPLLSLTVRDPKETGDGLRDGGMFWSILVSISSLSGTSIIRATAQAVFIVLK